jgi:osmotically-inducible protein OsmY
VFTVVIRRIGIVLLSSALVVVLSAIALSGDITFGGTLVFAAGVLFSYVVVRLSHAMFSANPSARRKARRRLVIAAVVPALILTPAVIGTAPHELVAPILLASVFWIALAMSWTSYILGPINRTTSQQPEEAMKDNLQLHTDVRDELAWDPRVDDKDIRIAAADGIVTLTGTVPSYAEKFEAERAAERVNGVKVVANELTVAVPVPHQRTDTDIAKAIADALAWDIEVPDTKIKASVTNAWITLDGEVDWRYQRDAAARAVRYLAGVRGISNNITLASKSVASTDVSLAIKAALERRADRTADHITVDTTGSIVTLSGSVPSFGERRAAEGAAWAAPGVTEVRDELAVVM